MLGKPAWMVFLLGASLALAGCGQSVIAGIATVPAAASPTAVITVVTSTPPAAPTATDTPLPTLTPAPAPTSTLTPSPTPTPTLTPAPTITATPRPPPANTATPLPSATPQSPAPLAPLTLEPAQVVQGGTALVRVRSGAGAQVQGTLDGAPLVFAQGQGAAWAVAGIPGLAKLGPRSVQVRMTDGSGRATALQGSLEVIAAGWPVENIDLPPGQGDLLAPATVLAERELLQTVSRQATAPPRWQGRFLQPADGDISSSFGIRRSYNGGPPSGQHEGMDFAVNAGAPIRAAAAGKVALARTLQVRGNAILVDHGAGVITGYYHLSELLVQEGQEVGRGALIGKAGATGLATGPHLHWDLLIGGVNVDPAEWLARAIP